MIHFPGPMLVVDLETTGMNPRKNGIVEIGAVLVDNHLEILQTFNSLCNPGERAERDPESMATHGIMEDAISRAPLEKWVLLDFFAEMATSNPILCSWGVRFDVNFLEVACEKYDIPWTLGYRTFDAKSAIHFYLAHKGFQLPWGGLSDYIKAVGMRPTGRSHAALDDAMNTVRLLQAAERL